MVFARTQINFLFKKTYKEHEMDFLMQHGPDIIQGILMILGGASIIAKITPTPKDDKIIDKILSFVHIIGLTKSEKK